MITTGADGALTAEGVSSSGGGEADSLSRRELIQMCKFLCCLSEIHETRLLCTEESLLQALGMQPQLRGALSATPAVSARTGGGAAADPRPLILTWLKDEGDRVDAVELCRDLLWTVTQDAVSSVLELVPLWCTLLGHMMLQRQYRVLVQTIIMIRFNAVFPTILLQRSPSWSSAASVKIRPAVLSNTMLLDFYHVFSIFTTDVNVKIDQVNVYFP